MIVGHICRDVFYSHDSKKPAISSLGGPASFAALAASTLGVRTALVTITPTTFSLIDELKKHKNIVIKAYPCRRETIFSLNEDNHIRQIALLHKAPQIKAWHIPIRLRRLPMVYFAPVIGECGQQVLSTLKCQQVVVGAQGWLREPKVCGQLVPTIAREMLDPPKNVYAIIFSEWDHPAAEDIAKHLIKKGRIVIITRGQRGATLMQRSQHWHIPAWSAQQTHPTGAGDVFGVVFTLGIYRGLHLLAAAQLAAFAAARVVEGPGLGRLMESKDFIMQSLKEGATSPQAIQPTVNKHPTNHPTLPVG